MDAMSRRDMLLAALVASLWGFNFVVIAWGMAGIPPLLFVAIRFLVVAAFALVVPRPATGWRVVVAVGVFMSLGQFGLLYTSMALGLQPGLAALLLQAQVVFTIVIAAAVLRERPTAPQVVGVNQVIVIVPESATTGDAIPIQIRVNGITTSGRTTVAVEPL